MGRISALHRNDIVKQKRISNEEGKYQGLDCKKTQTIVQKILDSSLILELWYPPSVLALGSSIIFLFRQCLTSPAVQLQDAKQQGCIQREYLLKQSIRDVIVS